MSAFPCIKPCIPLTHTRRLSTTLIKVPMISRAKRTLYRRLYSALRSSGQRGRKRLVILGTGWGSYSVLKKVDKKLFDVIVISPRNHFLFTPLLASTTVGTLEFRSIIEPVRYSMSVSHSKTKVYTVFL